MEHANSVKAVLKGIFKKKFANIHYLTEWGVLLVSEYGLFYNLRMKLVNRYKRIINRYFETSYPDCENYRLSSISDFVINCFTAKCISENDIKLIKFILANNSSQKDFDDFIADWDIEEEGGNKALLLSYFMKSHQNIKISEYNEPRLKGILQYYRFRNLKLFSHFKKVCNKLKENNIDILIIKGGAIKHYRPELPRIMGDIDILVKSKKDYNRSKKIVEELGYKYLEYGHSIDLHEQKSGENIFDIHHRLDMGSHCENKINKDFFKRATKEKVFDIDGIYVPCPEDMLFISLVNLSKNLIRGTSIDSILYAIVDSQYFLNLKPDFDWNIVRQNAIKTNSKEQIYITIKFINQFVPVKMPEMFEEDFNKYGIIAFYNNYLKELKEKNHPIKIKNSFKSMDNMKTYLKLKPHYFLLKRKFIKKHPNIAKNILQREKGLV